MSVAHRLSLFVQDQELVLDWRKGLFVPATGLLVVSDLHVGKSAHFRRYGLPVSGEVLNKDLSVLDELIAEYTPSVVLINGDLFHSQFNEEFSLFQRFVNRWKKVLDIALVPGNHDRFHESFYTDMGIHVFGEGYSVGNIRFIHDIRHRNESDAYFITGHVHPGIQLRSRIREKLKLPCFCFKRDYALMPAFSELTGLFLIKTDPEDRVIAATGKGLISV